MINYLWIIVLINMLLAWMILQFFQLLALNFLSREKKCLSDLIFEKLRKDKIVQNLTREFFLTFDLTVKLKPFFDERIEEIIQKVALQVPMGDYLIAGAIGQKIKSKVKQEVASMIPEVQGVLLQQFSESEEITEMLEKKLKKFDPINLLCQFLIDRSKKINVLKWLMVLLAGLVGIVEVLLFAIHLKNNIRYSKILCGFFISLLTLELLFTNFFWKKS